MAAGAVRPPRVLPQHETTLHALRRGEGKTQLYYLSRRPPARRQQHLPLRVPALLQYPFFSHRLGHGAGGHDHHLLRRRHAYPADFFCSHLATLHQLPGGPSHAPALP